MKYLITLLILICASPLFAQQSAQTNNAAVIEQLQERIASIEKQNEALKSEIDSLRQANDTLYSVFKSDIKKAEEYKKSNYVNWSCHVTIIDSLAAFIGLIITVFIGYQVVNIRKLKKRVKAIRDTAKTLQEKNEYQEKLNDAFKATANELERTKESMERLQKKQKELSVQIEDKLQEQREQNDKLVEIAEKTLNLQNRHVSISEQMMKRQKKQEEQNKNFQKAADELEQTTKSIEKVQKEQKELNYDLLGYNSLIFEIQASEERNRKSYLSAFLYYTLELRCIITSNEKSDSIFDKINSILDEVASSNKKYPKKEKGTVMAAILIVDKVCERIENEGQRQHIMGQLVELKKKALEKFKFE